VDDQAHASADDVQFVDPTSLSTDPGNGAYVSPLDYTIGTLAVYYFTVEHVDPNLRFCPVRTNLPLAEQKCTQASYNPGGQPLVFNEDGNKEQTGEDPVADVPVGFAWDKIQASFAVDTDDMSLLGKLPCDEKTVRFTVASVTSASIADQTQVEFDNAINWVDSCLDEVFVAATLPEGATSFDAPAYGETEFSFTAGTRTTPINPLCNARVATTFFERTGGDPAAASPVVGPSFSTMTVAPTCPDCSVTGKLVTCEVDTNGDCRALRAETAELTFNYDDSCPLSAGNSMEWRVLNNLSAAQT
jgi:hypothetical protein